MVALGAVVFLLVTVAFIRALTAPPEETVVGQLPAESGDDPATTRRKARAVGASVAATVLILLVVMIQAIVVSRETSAHEPYGEVAIEVTGLQWWWHVRYLHERPDQQFATANEVHIPVGEPVLVKLRSADVIHSFWVPNLQGKVDMIPGRENALRITADRPGRWRGQCAEFCGLQHAKMAFWVVAHEPEDFAAWRAAQLAPAAVPRDSLAAQGERVFTRTQCAYCHTVRGTLAGGRTGPDLTHFGSRLTIGAGSLPNNRGNLSGWVLNPQSIKPGALMPATPLDGPSMRALVAYLESLQ